MSENEIIFPKNEKLCVFCKKNLLIFAHCKICGGFLCKNCFSNHKNDKKFKEHNYEINGYRKYYDKKCPTHPEKELKYFCETCSDLICDLCSFDTHVGHDYFNITNENN